MQKPRIKCKGYRDEINGHIEYDCGYHTEVDCEFCIINLGEFSPVTGKSFRGNVALYLPDYEKRFGRIDEYWRKLILKESKPKAARKLKSTNKRLRGVRCTNGQPTLP